MRFWWTTPIARVLGEANTPEARAAIYAENDFDSIERDLTSKNKKKAKYAALALLHAARFPPSLPEFSDNVKTLLPVAVELFSNSNVSESEHALFEHIARTAIMSGATDVASIVPAASPDIERISGLNAAVAAHVLVYQVFSANPSASARADNLLSIADTLIRTDRIDVPPIMLNRSYDPSICRAILHRVKLIHLINTLLNDQHSLTLIDQITSEIILADKLHAQRSVITLNLSWSDRMSGNIFHDPHTTWLHERLLLDKCILIADLVSENTIGRPHGFIASPTSFRSLSRAFFYCNDQRHAQELEELAAFLEHTKLHDVPDSHDLINRVKSLLNHD